VLVVVALLLLYNIIMRVCSTRIDTRPCIQGLPVDENGEGAFLGLFVRRERDVCNVDGS